MLEIIPTSNPTPGSPSAQPSRSLVTSVALHIGAAVLLFSLHITHASDTLTSAPLHFTRLTLPPAPVPNSSPRSLPPATSPAEESPQPSAERVFQPPPRVPRPEPQTPELALAALSLPNEPRVALQSLQEMPQIAAPVLRTDNLEPALLVSAPASPTRTVTADTGFTVRTGASHTASKISAVAGSGFSSVGMETSLPVRSVTRQASGFADAKFAATASPIAQHQATTWRPVQILEKPKPAYTSDARKLGLEGEVLIEVTFAANGQTHVLRVIRGLGHGLDEEALIAARAIRFQPAEQGGVPVDSTVIVHILFQLA